MRPFGSVAVFVGPLVQVARGAIIAVVLLPFREVFGRRHGWLWLWGLLVGVGIVSTSAAAPSSLEGIVYSELPLWYHAIGLPEMLIQTLAFSALVAFYERNPDGALAVLPPVFSRLLGALVVASLAFAGYAIVSVAFALLAGARIDADENLTLEVQGPVHPAVHRERGDRVSHPRVPAHAEPPSARRRSVVRNRSGERAGISASRHGGRRPALRVARPGRSRDHRRAARRERADASASHPMTAEPSVTQQPSR